MRNFPKQEGCTKRFISRRIYFPNNAKDLVQPLTRIIFSDKTFSDVRFISSCNGEVSINFEQTIKSDGG